MRTLLLGILGGFLIAVLAGVVYFRSSNAVNGGPPASDRALLERIESSFDQDPALRDEDVSVDVDRGVATLTGMVATEAERTHAGELARVAGATSVSDRITVDGNRNRTA